MVDQTHDTAQTDPVVEAASTTTTDDLKQVEFYAANVNAWINTRFERDKSLLTLSAGGIGLLITIALAKGFQSTSALLIYCVALFSFVICLVVVLWVFQQNSHYLEDVANGKNTDDPLLTWLDKVVNASFILGVFMSAMMGVSFAVDSLLEKKEKEVSEESKRAPSLAQDSVNRINNLSPQPLAKSLNGLSAMNPAAQQSQQQAQPQPPQTPATKESGGN